MCRRRDVESLLQEVLDLIHKMAMEQQELQAELKRIRAFLRNAPISDDPLTSADKSDIQAFGGLVMQWQLKYPELQFTSDEDMSIDMRAIASELYPDVGRLNLSQIETALETLAQRKRRFRSTL